MAELNLNSDSLYLLYILFIKFTIGPLFLFFAHIKKKKGNEEKESSWKINLLKECNFSHSFQLDLSGMLFEDLLP